MMEFLIELRKQKRTGIIWILIAVGIVGALYSLLNFGLRKDSLLGLPLPPMDILLTQLYGVVLIFNLFGVIMAACLIYQLEFKGQAVRKMYVLPITLTKYYLSKFVIVTGGLFMAIVLENAALAKIGLTELSQGAFDWPTLLRFAGYSFATTLPVLTFMLLIAAHFENIWLPLGVGVIGFLTGLIFATVKPAIFLLHPFVLLFRPAVAMTAEVDPKIVVLLFGEAAIFLAAGLIATKKIRYV
ncbi:ABC transporter permease [Enterococcus sp. AZ072]|uniref:ABC transporter permease n=1 Tax=unclassified Enterococcus TaxID=2608891 RepID=UPI003D2B1645